MSPSCISLLLVAVIPLLSGCVMVNMHSVHPVEVRVIERATGKPVSHAKMGISYGYTGYGVFYVFRVPKPEEAETDETGTAVLPMVDFAYETSFGVEGTSFRLTSDVLRKGGFPSGSYWSGGGQTGQPLLEHLPPIIVQLTPTQ
jgi:hypothetical protein